MIELPRSSGVQLHLTSLPGGRLGPEAYRFVDWLAAAGQTWWQVLPLGPPDRYRSPYKARSAFAAWPGLLVDPRAPVSAAEVVAFRDREAFWAADWERFSARGALGRPGAVRARVGVLCGPTRRSGGSGCSATWRSTWRPAAPTTAPIPSCSGRASWQARHRMRSRTPDSCGATRCTTGRRCGGGDTAGGSSGCGGRCRCSTWPGSTTSGGSWPTGRCRRAHGRRSAGAGSADPGVRCSRALEDQLGTLSLVAEDLGVITPAVDRAARVARASRDGRAPVRLRPGRRGEPARVREPRRGSGRVHGDARPRHGCWMVLGAFRGLRSFVDASFARYGVVDRQPWWSLIRLALRSPARVAMVQAQDVLGLGSSARMNDPGRAGGSWRWRMEAGALTPALARRLREATEEARRLVGPGASGR